ncbi:MAG: hypothetical protein RLZZ537_1216 [Pseudomonadota bacterium]
MLSFAHLESLWIEFSFRNSLIAGARWPADPRPRDRHPESSRGHPQRLIFRPAVVIHCSVPKRIFRRSQTAVAIFFRARKGALEIDMLIIFNDITLVLIGRP